MDNIKLFDREFEEIFELAKKTLEDSSGEWDNFQYSDPGVTMVEVFAMLKDLQQFYMEQVNEKSIKQLMFLFGIEGEKGSCSRYVAGISPEGENEILEGQIFKYRDDFFRSTKYREKLACKIKGLIVEGSLSEKSCDLPIESGRPISIFDRSDKLIIELDGPISNKEISFLFEMEDNCRNPFNRNCSENMSEIKHYYQINHLDEVVYKEEISLKSDTTYDFLYSGTCNFFIKGEDRDKQSGERYFIIWELGKNGYDIQPQIIGIHMNPLFFEQSIQLVNSKEWCVNNSSDNKFPIDNMDFINGNIELFLGKDDEYFEAEKYSIITENGGYFLAIYDEIADFEKVRLISMDKVYKEEEYVFSGKGYSNQEFEVGHNNIVYDNFEIMVKQKGVWRIWNKTDEIKICDKYSEVYEFDNTKGIMQFGDGITGKVLPKGKDNLRITCLKLSKFDEGTYLGFDSEIDSSVEIERESVLLELKGNRPKSLETLYDEFREKVLEYDLLLTSDDYKKKISSLSGLLINDVDVKINGDVVNILVNVGGDKESKGWKDYYYKRIKDFVEENKLITSNIYLEIV